MTECSSIPGVTRRNLLKLGSVVLAAGTERVLDLGAPRVANAQSPKRGGIFRIAVTLDPVGLDPHQTISFATSFKLDQEPFKDVRVRRALGRASNWKEGLEISPFSQGHGAPNPAVPAASAEWSIPIDQLPQEGRELYEQDVSVAKRMLGQAGHPHGFKTIVETTGGYGPDYMDGVQVALKNWKAAGIETDLRLKEYGAFIASTVFGKFDQMMVGLRGAWLDPHSYLQRAFMPGQPLNSSGVNDPRLTDMINLQRRTFDVTKRREILYDIQRSISQQAYYLYFGSERVVSAWEPYVRNWAPNNGFDYGGRLMAAWLDR
jgi:peptide/nickel transport system substrate-binding protein